MRGSIDSRRMCRARNYSDELCRSIKSKIKVMDGIGIYYRLPWQDAQLGTGMKNKISISAVALLATTALHANTLESNKSPNITPDTAISMSDLDRVALDSKCGFIAARIGAEHHLHCGSMHVDLFEASRKYTLQPSKFDA